MVDPLDLVAQNDGKGPDTEVTLPGRGSLIGLHIHGVEGYPMLGIRLDERARPLSFATADAVFYVDTNANVPAQMNPRRIISPGEDA